MRQDRRAMDIPSPLWMLPLLAALASPPAPAYDNPTQGTMSCVGLTYFQVTRAGAGAASHGAMARIENLCGRAVEVSFCFRYAQPVEGSDAHCVVQPLRPGGENGIELSDSPVLITGPEYRWKYLPVQ